jgi:erythromycin esterase-like protein
MHPDCALSALIAAAGHRMDDGAGADDALLELIGDARFVLLGEATHGSHQFYARRAQITQRLIQEKGFAAVALEADWPDAQRVNRHVLCTGTDADATRALDGFERFPSWMWRNTDVVRFVTWLRAHNAAQPPEARVGVFGLDLYSLFSSMSEVLRYLDRVDPLAARAARVRYACFDQYGADSQRYAVTAGIGRAASCEREVALQFEQLRARAADYLRHAGPEAHDAHFDAEQNALLVQHAEHYYRTMLRGRVASWNVRDRHMADTLAALERHLSARRGMPAKIVVWAHNSHIGDARATEAGQRGEWNLGQLVRERYPGQACLVGFSTYEGWVSAAAEWDGPVHRERLRPALPGSCEHLCHQSGLGDFMLPLRPAGRLRRALLEHRLERAVGVLYLPNTERYSHYFHVQLARQFDALIHIDVTTALQVLATTESGKIGEAPETFPVGV